ncbi:hypothetical protein HCH_06280 [Hahella chejuensis KCTC 2396]|uniref:Uncharacterized protein n=1 Tax=Hahella chejuensis (strain KCTC 2396) TaxID=349521 RepID=Q2S8U7_HAHCH|nr:hypothetical protein HCH_06280 [Hahella chejuensis KCTC 2396]
MTKYVLSVQCLLADWLLRFSKAAYYNRETGNGQPQHPKACFAPVA